MDEDEALRAFAALSGTSRLAIIRHLVRVGQEGLTAGTLSDALGASPSRTSFHLSSLESAGLITGARQSRSIVYRINAARLGALVSFLLDDCCAGDEEILACCRPGAKLRAE